MLKRITLLALFAAAPLAAQSAAPTALPQLSLNQQTALRCSAAFGLIASEQARSAPGAQDWPPLGQRGREYFVRSSARLMDETGASREQIRLLVQREVAALQADAAAQRGTNFPALMRSCLSLLDQAIPSKP